LEEGKINACATIKDVVANTAINDIIACVAVKFVITAL
jgi:hypothetical protein